MRICLRPNGATSGEVIECPDSIEDLASVAREMLEIESPVFFSATGDSVNSLSVLRDNDVIYVAKVGDMFSFQSKAASRAKEFEAFSKQKKREREGFFKTPIPRKKAKVSNSNLDSTCKISVGLVEWKRYKRKSYKPPKLISRKQVGHKMIVSVTIDKDATASCVLQKAVEAFKLVDTDMQDQHFRLLYPDFKNEVNALPGSEEPFSPRKYVELLGTYFSKVKLYIVTDSDWMACQLYSTQYQPVESGSDSEHDKGKQQNEKEKNEKDEKEEEESFNDDDEVYFKGQTPDKYKGNRESDIQIQCAICQKDIKSEEMSAIPVGCSCIFHQFCLEEWLKTSDDGSIKCPVCNTVFCEMDSSIFASELSDNSNQDVIPGPLNVASPSVESEIVRVDVDLTEVEIPTERSSPGYRYRQEYLPQFATEVMSEIETQDNVLDTHHSSERQNDTATDNTAMSEVCVHRTNLKEDLIAIFKSEASSGVASFKVIDERGEIEIGDGVGVTRDVIATFWHQFFASASVGDKEKVPCIRHDYQKIEWEAIGRILVYGFKVAEYFPVALSNAFLASCIFGEECITDDYLLTSFRWHITTDERETFDKIRNGDFVEDDDEVLEFLGNYKTFKRYTKDNISLIISELAHQELIQRPRYIAQCWAPLLAELKEYEHFKTPEAIVAFFSLKTPSARKVAKAIICNPISDAERQCLDFLKKFIRSLDASALGTFLKYTTGSDIMPESIVVSFTSMDGFARRPIAHTCGRHLELPHTYQSFSELSEEFTSLLRDKGAWGFNIV